MIQFGLVFALLAFSNSGHQTPPVTIQSLLSEMADRDALAKLPNPPFRQLQASSYDRAKTDPKNPKTWFANTDYGQFIRTEKNGERTEWVVMEHDGPGAITRMWTPLSADKDKMLIRFYLDGATKPAIEEKFNDLMRGRSFVKPPFAFIAWPDAGVDSGVGSDFYFPIPFAKSCKITMSEQPFYYSIGYRAYPTGTSVETFTKSGFERTETDQKLVGVELGFHDGSLRRGVGPYDGVDLTETMPPGPGAITRFELEVPKEIDSATLRSTIVEMTFDGEKTVWCPIGEFFGCGLHLKPVHDRYREMSEYGLMICNWVMPYRKTASIHVFGLGANKVKLRTMASVDPWKWDDRSMHFHANWHYQYPLASRPFSDWNYVTAKGQGVYVGDTLTVVSPVGAWYGEGDEKVYVDGESFPSHLGTGTEDYYGYAWGMAEHFSSPYISMPLRDLKGRENWTGITTTSRDRGLDAITFDKSLKFDMEVWDWADCKLAYSAATFWYARPGATSSPRPDPKGALQPMPEWGIKGAIECEAMDVLSKSEGAKLDIQSGALIEGTWSGGSQLFVQSKSFGDFVELKLPVAKSGKQHVILYATKSYDYGIIRFSLNGKPAKDLDLWNLKPIASGPIDLGEFDLKAGQATLRIEVVGTNPKSIGPRYYCGVDCVVLKSGR